MRHLGLLLLVAPFVALGGCDTKAKASDPRGGEKSKEFESCSSTMNCQDDLHCFDNVCRRTARSTVGDYFAALGANARAHGDIEAAIDAYNRAVGHYDAEKIALPPEIDCAYGAALAAGKAKKDHAELGARVLHRCILALPAGSSLRRQALADLATLADVGLDPLALGKNGLADVYLTRNVTPATDKLAVTVTASPQPSGKTYQAIPDKLAEPDMRTALVACWVQYNGATHKEALAVAIGFKSTYTPSEYEDESGVFNIKIDPPTALPAGSPEAAADQCVRAAVEPALKDLKTIRDAFATKLTITVK
ncbi:MAG: hypothetical protein ACM31C_27565 [Acidobacteriota bacterium]